MKILKRILQVIALLVLVIFVTVFGFKFYNDFKYRDAFYVEMGTYGELETYPTQLEGIDLAYVDAKGFQGFHLVPQEKKYEGMVIVFGGSEGSPNLETAQDLAEQGYETLAVFMFGRPHQPKNLVRVPLEQFEDVLDYAYHFIEKEAPLTVFGASKGAEYALNLATKYEDIDQLILFAPSSYTFAGLDFQDYGSSWTWKGKEVPYIDMQKASFDAFFRNILFPAITQGPIGYTEVYDAAILMDEKAEDKRIKVEDVKAKILMLAGDEDKVWNSASMAAQIKEQQPEAELYVYHGAGHLFEGNGVIATDTMRLAMGGSLEANQKAHQDSVQRILEFLGKYHSKLSKEN